MEELKQSHETEISQLKERLRKEKHSANAVVSDQVGSLIVRVGGYCEGSLLRPLELRGYAVSAFTDNYVLCVRLFL